MKILFYSDKPKKWPNFTKWPNAFFMASALQKWPNSSKLAMKWPIWQPWNSCSYAAQPNHALNHATMVGCQATSNYFLSW